jgi:hypothetical protein
MAHARTQATPRAISITSDSPFSPHPTPPPAPRRAGVTTRGPRATTIDSNSDTPAHVHATHVPSHYTLAPTVPSPFSGTLDASLDAIQDFGSLHAGTQGVVNSLLQPASSRADWPLILGAVYTDAGAGRTALEEVLCLATRTLLPEQITENRSAMARLYDRKKQLAIRLTLRYDMLRTWKLDGAGHTMAIASLPAPAPEVQVDPEPIGPRRAFMPSIISTLIVAPDGGWTTHAVRERMKHHVTDLDTYLLLSDEKISSWSDQTLLSMTAQVLVQWQWLRQNNDTLGEMELFGYEELEGRADECEWIADEIKKKTGRGGGGAQE